MKVTAVRLRVVEREKVKAFASITFDDEFVVHDVRVVQGDKGIFVAMPSRRLPNGEFRDVAHPIKSEVREMIQKAVLEEYEKVKTTRVPTATTGEDKAVSTSVTETPASTEEITTPEEQAPVEKTSPAESPLEEEPEEVKERLAAEETEKVGEEETKEESK